MAKNLFICLFSSAVITLTPIRLLAADSNSPPAAIRIALNAFIVTQDRSGNETLLPTTHVKPGDLIEYQASYSNVSTQTIRQLKGVLPIPAGQMQFSQDSARPGQAQASVDGSHFDNIPLMQKYKLANGRVKITPTPLEKYRALRWNFGDLAPGKIVKVSARMHVLESHSLNQGEAQ